MVFSLSPAETEIALRLLLATGIGALIGLERELKYSPAGIKTYSIIALGSCLFTILASSFNQNIATGIVTGVGFLGAGAIFRNDKQVRGLTTASLVWISAAMGMTIGFGYYTIALVGTVVVYMILIVIGYIEKTYLEKIAEEGLDLERTKENIRNLTKHLEKARKHIEKIRKLRSN